jgi:hypothetical protein
MLIAPTASARKLFDKEELHGRKPDSSTANWMIHSNYSLTMRRSEIRRDLAHEFSSGRATGSAESTKMGIHEQAVFSREDT